ncbi:MAG: high-affinity branched-chain amino acid ABC transporter permease LivM [Acetobacteraceae bacterium]|nr:high-affinity branched-chain amino acid ABC transporter permease LivM [Acetobacteraceae bacterium]
MRAGHSPPPRPAASPVAAALKDAGLAALVAFGVAAPMMGLRTVQGQSGLTISPRFDVVAIAVALVFAGRLLLRAWQHRGRSFHVNVPRLPGIERIAGPLLLALAVSLPFLPWVGRYQIDLGVLVLTYVMLGWGLNIVVGLAGLLDLGYVAFYAVGAYTYALSAQYLGFGFWQALPLAGLMAGTFGVLLGFPVLRLRGDYLAIVTLAFGEIIRIVLLNWTQLTGGPNGLSGIPRPTFFGLSFSAGGGPGSFADFFGLEPSPVHRIIFLYYIILVLALATNWLTIRLRRMPIGRAWEALREDEIACRSLGLNVTNTKLTAFATGATLAGLAGAFFATRQAFISPESFTFMESALILAIVVLGGLGSQIGVAIAALVMIGGFEVFRGFDEYRMLVFGVVMVSIMVARPRGLIGERTPSVVLKERKAIDASLVGEGAG